MGTLQCGICNHDFTPTRSAPAYPHKISREHRRQWSATVEPICSACVTSALGEGRLTVEGERFLVFLRDTSGNTSSCECCGAVISLRPDKRRKLDYCSSKCRQAIYRKRDTKPNTSTCEHCGAEFTARRGAKYCASKCRQAAYRSRA